MVKLFAGGLAFISGWMIGDGFVLMPICGLIVAAVAIVMEQR